MRTVWLSLAPRPSLLARSAERLGQPVDLLQVRNRRQQDQVVAPGFLVPPNEVLHGLRRGEIPGGDLLGEWSGEGVVLPKVVGRGLDRFGPKREVALPPELGAPRTPRVGPGGLGSRGSSREGPGRTAAVHVPVRIPRHPREGFAARPSDQQFWPTVPGRAGADGQLLPLSTEGGELLRE